MSLDASTAKSYRAIRGKDYFGRILKNVRAFRALQEREGHDRPRVSAWLTGLKETIAELPAFVKVAAEIGVKEVYLQRLVFFEEDAVGHARPDQALYERMNREEAAYLEEATALAQSRGMTFSASGAVSEPGMSLKRRDGRLAVVDVPAAVDGDVFHRQRPRAALLHRAVLPARLRELHARRRHPAVAARNLERRRPTSRFATGCSPTSRRPRARAAGCGGACERRDDAPRSAASPSSQRSTRRHRSARSCAPCRATSSAGSSSPTAAAPMRPPRARAAPARDVIDAGRGYGRACLAAAQAAEGADILVFMDGDGADDPASIAALVAPIRSGDIRLRDRLAAARRT